MVNGGTSSLGVIAPLMDQKSPEMGAAIASCTQIRDAIGSSADGCDVAAKACDAYATAIDEAHSAKMVTIVVRIERWSSSSRRKSIATPLSAYLWA